jgi:heme/copper-type cytochrome/quinol oxidase subunit 2
LNLTYEASILDTHAYKQSTNQTVIEFSDQPALPVTPTNTGSEVVTQDSGDSSSTDDNSGTVVAVSIVVSFVVVIVVGLIVYFSWKACRRQEDTKTLMDKINQQ